MFELGDQIAGYQLKSVLGRGGMGIVYEATQLSLNRSVALKVIAPGVSSDSAFRERFRREGPLQARIDHPHIVSVFEAGDWEGHLFLAMRLVRGPSLRELIREGPLDAQRVLRILTPIADALDTAHEESLIHRDVKPHNILVGRGDHAFLADFGLTKSLGEQSLTKTGHFVGTLDYIAPEQVQGEDASRASDIYALAAVLYETLTGSPPFSRSTDAATLYAHVADPPPRPSAARAELGPEIDAVIAHGLAKIPSERPATALMLMDEAERALRTASGRARSITSARSVAPPSPTPRKSATTDVLAEPDLSARTVNDTDEEPLRTVVDTSQPTVVEPVEAPPAATERQPDRPTEPERAPARPSALAPAALVPTVADRVAEPPASAKVTAAPPPARTQPPRASRLGRGLLAIVGAALVAGGFFVTSGGEEKTAPPPTSATVTTAAYSVAVPRAWTKRTPTPEIEGLTLRDGVAYGLARQQAAIMLVGIEPDAAGPTLLPRAFLRRLPSKPDRSDRVALTGDLRAQRYAGLLPQGGETRLTLLVVPTTSGTLTVVCREGGAGADFVATCQRAAASLRLRGSRAYGLGADEQYGERLKATLERLEKNRASAIARLRQARAPSGQGSRAAAVAAAYQGAARSLSATPPNPLVRDHNAAIRAALRAQGRRYDELSRAARRERPKTYRRTVAAIEKGEARIREAIVALADVGYVR